MKALFKAYPFRSAKKFVPIAIKHGFDKKDSLDFINNSIQYDQRYDSQRSLMRPIYSEHRGAYQFDTFVNGASPPYYLIAINVNTRKAYAYPMQTEASPSVLTALKNLKSDVETITAMTSDQDAAYLTEPILTFMKSNNFDYRTTEDHNHNRLSIKNRFIRTLRDMATKPHINTSKMNSLLKAYNTSTHSSLGHPPNEMTAELEEQYIKRKRAHTDVLRLTTRLEPGTTVRIVNENKPFTKKRSNLSNELYTVAANEWSNIIIKGADYSVATFPRFKLIPSSRGKLAKSIDNAKRGIVEAIIDMNKDKYKVRYEGGVTDWIPKKNIREGRPTIQSPLEFDYFKAVEASK